MRRLVLLGLLAVAGAACGSSNPQPPPQAAPPTTSEQATTESAERPRTKPQRKKAKAPPGIPRFVAGYRGWVKLNDGPIPPRDADPHLGTKNVFASRRPGTDSRFPAGTIVVKESVRPGADFVGLIAIMRKQRGADPAHHDWIFVEYTREAPDSRFGETASGAVCWSCHIGAEATDYVFTLGG